MNRTTSWSQSGIFIDTISNYQIIILRVILYKFPHSAGPTLIKKFKYEKYPC